MAYAVLENGNPRLYRVLPQTYKSPISTVLGGFDKLPDDELAKHGFYPVVEPTITDSLFQRRGRLIYDESNSVFTYEVLETTYAEIDILKQQKHTKIDQQKKQLLESTKDDVLEALELGEAIPTDISASRADIRTQAVKLKAEIDTLTTQREILTYTGSIVLTTTTGSI